MKPIKKTFRKYLRRFVKRYGQKGVLAVLALLICVVVGSLAAVVASANDSKNSGSTAETVEMAERSVLMADNDGGADALESGTAVSDEGEETAETGSGEESAAAESGALEETETAAETGVSETAGEEASSEETEVETTEIGIESGFAGIGAAIETVDADEAIILVPRFVKCDVPYYRTRDDSGEPAGTLSRGDKVLLISENGAWSRISLGEEEGYVRRMYLREESAYKGLIAIDPGHQAHQNSDKEPVGPGSEERKMKVSSGTIGDYTGVSEYVLVLEVSLKLRDELLRRGYDVLMIRTTNDVDISNVERAQMANEASADVFLRIHADGSDSHQANGCMTICQTSSNPYNSNIYKECRLLASEVLKGLLEETGARDRGVYESDTYSGINWSEVPVTIVEMGFMSNEQEDRLMQTDEYQDKLVKGMANGVDAFMASYRPDLAVQETEEETSGEETGASGEGSEVQGSDAQNAETLTAGELETLPESGEASESIPAAEEDGTAEADSEASGSGTAEENGTVSESGTAEEIGAEAESSSQQ